MEPLRVLITDDHTLVRDGLRALITAAPDLEVVGEATTGEEAVGLAAQLRPDVILMDLQMPGIGGVEATRQIAAQSPQVGILVLTTFEDDHSVFSAMRAGARGYLLKGAKTEEMLRAVQVVAGGEAIFSASIATRLMTYFANMRPASIPNSFPDLTEREREILTMIAQNATNQEIADELVLSVKTVRNHVSNILSKLQVAGREEARERARRAGLD